MDQHCSSTSRLILLFLFCVVSGSTAAEDLRYLGQNPPGPTLKLFAPGVISVAGTTERSLSLSPKGDELFFTRSSGWPYSRIMYMKRNGNQWSTPEIASFLQDDWATQAVFSPDGQYLYFSSSRGRTDIRYYSLWRAKKDGDKWLEPERIIDMGGMPIMEFHPSVTWDGSVYFLRWDYSRQTGDIYVARLVDGQYTDPVNVGFPISTQYNEVRPTVDPNEKYLLFESDRPGGYGETDIYITFKNDDGTWSAPRNLGPTVNSPSVDDTPNFSPDGKYWFSSVNGDVHWMEALVALPISNGPIRNLSSNLRFSSIQCAINYADNGNEIVLAPGIYQESIDFFGKDIVLRSEDSNDPYYIGGTIINGDLDGSVLNLSDNSSACEIAGLTIRAGSIGVSGTSIRATIRNCRIMDNTSHGVILTSSSPHLLHCLITANGGNGIAMHPSMGRDKTPCAPVIENCIIVNNGQATIDGGEPVVVDSIID